ncbi:hypothetical protein IFR04_006632 [Cadophora malorum]|uniref:Uncharacterized protein n=1 Tax=Cadophora malorum TaxID=108018 RepID=A0A8H7WBB1_9HELO|nr:hypothetical protein IFR04_006632 [Cadophora malorum]
MGIYSPPPNIRPISSTQPQSHRHPHSRPYVQAPSRSQTYPSVNTTSYQNIRGQAPTNLTLENASLHSQLIALRRELARREAQQSQPLRERREAELLDGSAKARLSPQFYSQVPLPAQYSSQSQMQYQVPGQSQYLGQSQSQYQTQAQTRLIPTESDPTLRAAIEDLHASIIDFAAVYSCSDFGGRGSGSRKEKGRHGDKARRGSAGTEAEVWSEIPATLKPGIREVEVRRGVFLPSVLRTSQSASYSSKRSSRRSSGYGSSSSEDSRRDRDRDRGRDRYEGRGSDGRREAGVRTLLAALLTREIYLAMWENAFFLADEENAVRTRYKERKKASLARASGTDGRDGRRDSRDSRDGRRGSKDSRRDSGGEFDVTERMITRSTILGDTYRDLWNSSPASAYTWRTQYFSVIYQELLASSSPSSSYPSSTSSYATSSSSITPTLLRYTSTLASCILSGELAPLFKRLSSKEDMEMRKELCGILARAVGAFVRLRVAGGEMGNRRVEVGDVGEGLRGDYWRGGEMVELGREMRDGRGYAGLERGGYDELDGRKVDVVVSPPVYVCREGRGGENGRRVLVPAVVVVEDEW